MIFRRYILPLFRSLYFVLFFVAAVLSGCVWYFGPMIGTEEWRPLAGLVTQWAGLSSAFILAAIASAAALLLLPSIRTDAGR